MNSLAKWRLSLESKPFYMNVNKPSAIANVNLPLNPTAFDGIMDHDKFSFIRAFFAFAHPNQNFLTAQLFFLIQIS